MANGQLPVALSWVVAGASNLLATVPFVATVCPFAFRSSIQLILSAHQACLGREGLGGVLGRPDKGVESGTHTFVIGN